MAPRSLQDGIDQAGSAIKLLWDPDAEPWTPPVVEREYAGWRKEQAGWESGVVFMDLSYHSDDLFIEGPDATRLLSEVSVNNYESFAIGQAKQFVAVTEAGLLISDSILLREDEKKYTLTGVEASHHWVQYHAKQGKHDVSLRVGASAEWTDHDPELFRYQVQGPLATELIEQVFGGPLPPVKFFHSIPVSLDGRNFRALRHTMAGQAGFEFVGKWRDGAAVKEALLRAGEPLGLVRVGALAYPTAGLVSGWVPNPVPAIYTAPELQDYREYLDLYSVEGQRPLHGTFYSENIEDYYCSPFELGYGRVISFNHDFIGKDALEKAKDDVRRTKVTLAYEVEDVRSIIGSDFVLDYGQRRVESGSDLVGVTFYEASIEPAGTVLSLALVDNEHAEPGTEVTVVWGEHPGPGVPRHADLQFPRIRATVYPAPYDGHARTTYRHNA